jgi:GNAT superfamily N-acetyltransferase
MGGSWGLDAGRGPTATGDDGDGTGYVRQVVTDAACVRRGIGRALMGQVMTQAQAAGVRRLDCLSSGTAVPFYASLGFQEIGPVEVPLRPGIDFPAVRMLRGLGG